MSAWEAEGRGFENEGQGGVVSGDKQKIIERDMYQENNIAQTRNGGGGSRGLRG